MTVNEHNMHVAAWQRARVTYCRFGIESLIYPPRGQKDLRGSAKERLYEEPLLSAT